jgi:hypothetical protein
MRVRGQRAAHGPATAGAARGYRPEAGQASEGDGVSARATRRRTLIATQGVARCESS